MVTHIASTITLHFLYVQPTFNCYLWALPILTPVFSVSLPLSSHSSLPLHLISSHPPTPYFSFLSPLSTLRPIPLLFPSILFLSSIHSPSCTYFFPFFPLKAYYSPVSSLSFPLSTLPSLTLFLSPSSSPHLPFFPFIWSSFPHFLPSPRPPTHSFLISFYLLHYTFILPPLLPFFNLNFNPVSLLPSSPSFLHSPLVPSNPLNISYAIIVRST